MTYRPQPVGVEQVDPAAMDDELMRIAQAFEDSIDPIAVLYGDVLTVPMGTARQVFTNYDAGGVSSNFPGAVTPGSGTIRIDDPGLYKFTVNVIGEQTGNAQNQSALIFLRDLGNVDWDMASLDVSTPQTDVRHWSGVRLVNQAGGAHDYQIGVYATGNLNNLDAHSTLFLVERFFAE